MHMRMHVLAHSAPTRDSNTRLLTPQCRRLCWMQQRVLSPRLYILWMHIDSLLLLRLNASPHFAVLNCSFNRRFQQAMAWIRLAEGGALRIRRRVGHCIEYSLGSLCWEAHSCHFNNGVVGEGEWSLVHLVMLWGWFLGSLWIVTLGNKTTHCL